MYKILEEIDYNVCIVFGFEGGGGKPGALPWTYWELRLQANHPHRQFLDPPLVMIKAPREYEKLANKRFCKFYKYLTVHFKVDIEKVGHLASHVGLWWAKNGTCRQNQHMATLLLLL